MIPTYTDLTTNLNRITELYEAQSNLLKKYQESFDKLYDRCDVIERQRKDEASRYSVELNKVLEDNNKRIAETVKSYENWIKSRSLNLLTARVVDWETRVLGKTASEDRWERSMRLLEEALELAQVEKVSVAEVEFLVKRIYSRPVGELSNEAGGVMVCMVALAHAAHFNLMDVLSKEVDRIENLDPEAVRQKQRQKWDAGVGINPDV